jgi:hypothetical protein
MHARRLLVPLLALMLAACGDGDGQGTPRTGAGGTEEALPTPQRSDGSVTGMPHAPGPGDVPIAGAPPPPPPEMLPGEAFGLPPLEDNPETGLLADEDGSQPTGAEPGVPEAVAIVRGYYAAINARDFARAYALWSDGGRSSGQSPQQFAEAFAGVDGITVQIGEPVGIEAAAGSRFIEVPVSITSTRRNGEQRRYRGSYVLRRAMADGATTEQRAWRIASADLREVQT